MGAKGGGRLAWGLVAALASAPALGACTSVVHRRTSLALGARYLPLEVGEVWRYAIVADDGRHGTGTVSVDGVDYGGSNGAVPEYRLREDLLDGTVWVWDDQEAERVACEQEEIDDRTGTVLAEETFDPPLTVLDEQLPHLAPGAKWPETFLATTPNAKGRPKSRRAEVKWEVEALADPVTVPAGTFTCLRVRRTWKHHPAIVSWYAKGVGLIKQTGAGALGDETLALLAAPTLPPAGP
ncbi:MAG TPA: hypothetical protein VKZ18_07110 [Polyangia bacterium]|nr:hypothetical protein [Polyangia bacterium]